MTETLRNEWGFEGVAITDQASFEVFVYEDLYAGLEAGTDLWLNTDTELWKLSGDEMNDTIVNYMQRAAYVAPAVYNILVTFITGGVSMVIFFFVFKIIFPEGEAKKNK